MNNSLIIIMFLKSTHWRSWPTSRTEYKRAKNTVFRHLPLPFPPAVIPAIECDVRAGKINLPEFIVKCPAHCKETKQQVYGTGVFASISSICNAAIHR